MVCSNIETRVCFALRDQGIACLPDFSIREALREGRLVSILDAFCERRARFFLLWPSGRQVSPKLRAFIDFSRATGDRHAGLKRLAGPVKPAADGNKTAAATERLIGTSTPCQAASMINIETPTYYTATKEYELSLPLETDLDADVVVIGGGFSGINTALELAEHGITDIVVLEARHLGFGGTGRNGGQIVAGIGHDLEKIRKDVGEDGLRAIFEISDLGTDIIKGRIERYAIDADFCHGYGYMWASTRAGRRPCRPGKRSSGSLGSPHEIRYLHGAEVRQIIGSDAYGSALLHMGGGHVHSLNLLLGEAKALAGLGARIFEYSPALEVQYGERIRVRTAKGSVTANKLLWACDGFLNRLEPEAAPHHHQYLRVPDDDRAATGRTDPADQPDPRRLQRYPPGHRLLPGDQREPPLFGAATPFVERIPGDLKAWNRKLMLKIFPYLEHVRIDLAWGGPMACSTNLFPQIGSLSGRPNAFFVQGYSGFGVTPSHIVCKVLAEGMSEGSARYDLLSSVRRIPIHGRTTSARCCSAQARPGTSSPATGTAGAETYRSLLQGAFPMAITVIRHGITLDELDA